ARKWLGVDRRLVRTVRGRRVGQYRSAGCGVRTEARDPRRQLVVRCEQRALRSALHPRTTGQGLQPRVPRRGRPPEVTGGYGENGITQKNKERETSRLCFSVPLCDRFFRSLRFSPALLTVSS